MQLQELLAQFSASGISVFAISPDGVETLAAFAAEHGITYPLLSDSDSSVIREFGILNTLLREGEPEYGIPYPGSYLVGSDGRVADKWFHREYQLRETAATVLRTGFGIATEGLPARRIRHESSGLVIDVSLGAATLSFMQQADLDVRFTLPDGIHVYGRPVPDGYRAVDVQIAPAETIRVGQAVYPATHPLRITGLDDEFNVYEANVLIRIPIVLAARPSDEFTTLTLDIAVGYQACAGEFCFTPVTHTIQLVVPVVP